MKKKIRWIGLTILLAAVFLIAGVGIYIGFSVLGLKRIEPSPGSGYQWPYYLYVTKGAEKRAMDGQTVYILVLPNNTGTTSDPLEKDDQMSRIAAIFGKTVFGQLDTIILVPVFPRPAEYPLIYTHALDNDTFTTDIEGLKRIDLQLIAMIDEVRETYRQKNWNIDNKVLMWGFSASGMFTNRFTLVHPDRVLAASIGSPGGWPIAPVETWEGQALTYPVGIFDLQKISGENSNIEAYKKIPQLFFIGDQDTNDSVPFDDSYDDKDARLIDSLFGDTPVTRWPAAEKIYKSIGANVKFVLYKNVEHKPTINSFFATIELFKQAIANQE